MRRAGTKKASSDEEAGKSAAFDWRRDLSLSQLR